MTTNIKAEAVKILTIAGIEVANEVLSCNEGDPARTDDDTCRIDEMDWQKTMEGKGEGHHPRDVRMDDLFSRANALNLARNAPRDLDTHNYFFRLNSNAVFFRQERFERTNLGEGGLLYRAQGSSEWKQLDFAAVKASPSLTAAVVPILLDTIRARADYDRLNGNPHHGDDYGYAQAKAVMWLNDLIPADDSSYRDALLRAFPSMSADGQFFAWYRFQSEGHGQDLAPALVALSEDRSKDAATRAMARSLLRNVVPSVSPEDWSSARTVRTQFAWEGFGAAYFALPLRESAGRAAPRGETEPAGSYTAIGAGVQLCIGPRIDCAQRKGLRVGVLGEAGMMLNGYDYYFFGGKVFIGNENIVGFIEAGLNLEPTGGFMGQGVYGEYIYKPALGAGARIIPHLKYFPLAIPVGFRLDPTEPRNTGIYVGLGGAQ